MKKLTKENFWNELYAEQPEAMQKFCEWIDEYKIRNVWGNLFHPHVKFHDLPIAMQYGIMDEFFAEQKEERVFALKTNHNDIELFIRRNLREVK